MSQLIVTSSLPVLSLGDEGLVFGNFRLLRDAATAGRTCTPLSGKRVALLCEDETTPEAVVFRYAAEGLGAYVANVRLSVCEQSTDEFVRDFSRMLGLLYDAAECKGMPQDLLRRVRKGTDIPIYGDLSSSSRCQTALLNKRFHADWSEESQRLILQAMLV